MKRYVKVVLGEWNNSSRDYRELSVVKELGYDIVVVASTKSRNGIFEDNVEGYNVIRIPTIKYGYGGIKGVSSKLRAIIDYIKQIRKLKPQVIDGHDYLAWIIGYIACGKQCRYVYDSHEFELYQKERSKLAFAIVKILEGFVLKHSVINMMVTDGIADEVQKIYRLKNRPIVVRNVPPLCRQELLDSDRCRKEYLDNLNISSNGTIVMHHGGLSEGRGIEQTIEAVSKMKDVGLVLMGYALDKEYEQHLRDLCGEFACKNRVYFKEAVDFLELYNYVSAADIGIVLIQNTCLSFWHSLPNKLFENIQARVPIIGSDMLGIGSIIDKYGVGLKIKPDDIDALVKSIELLQNDKELYCKIRENERVARNELCWEMEREVLKEELLKI